MVNTINTILLTRPKDRGSSIKLKLEALNYDVVDLPCLDIRNLNKRELSEYNNCSGIFPADFAILIFVSVNAVRGFFKLYSDIAAIKNIKIMAIGSATAQALINYGFNSVIFPQVNIEQTSEYFVNLPELLQIKNKNILLIRGDTSREYISTVIKQREANLTELIVYKTSCPDNLEKNINIKLSAIYDLVAAKDKKLLILITSNSILENFYNNLNTQINKKLLNVVLNAQLLVASERIAFLARQRGFSNIIVSNTMNEDSIIDIIKDIQ